MRSTMKLICLLAILGYVVPVVVAAAASRVNPSTRDWCPIVCHDPGTEWTYTRLPFGGEHTLSVWGIAAQIRAGRQISGTTGGVGTYNVGIIEREGGR